MQEIKNGIDRTHLNMFGLWRRGDIMERLNYDSIVYQTVHLHYTYTLGIENNPKHGGTTSINPEDFNVYGVDFWPDSCSVSM